MFKQIDKYIYYSLPTEMCKPMSTVDPTVHFMHNTAFVFNVNKRGNRGFIGGGGVQKGNGTSLLFHEIHENSSLGEKCTRDS